MIRAIRDAMSRLRSMGNGISMTWTGNKGVGVRRRRHSPKWRHIGKRRVRVMKKLDESKVRWIIRESRRGTPTGAIAKNAGISARWVQKLCRRYAGIPMGSISYPGNLGRPRKSLPGRREHSAMLSAVSRECSGAVSLESVIERTTGMHIPHNAIHAILRDADIAEEQSTYVCIGHAWLGYLVFCCPPMVSPLAHIYTALCFCRFDRLLSHHLNPDFDRVWCAASPTKYGHPYGDPHSFQCGLQKDKAGKHRLVMRLWLACPRRFAALPIMG